MSTKRLFGPDMHGCIGSIARSLFAAAGMILSQKSGITVGAYGLIKILPLTLGMETLEKGERCQPGCFRGFTRERKEPRFP